MSKGRTTISKIKISKTELLSMPENERIFFIQAGDLLNELSVFSKLNLFCINGRRGASGVKKIANDVELICLIRILVGKLHEGYNLIRKWYYGTTLSMSYDDLLDKVTDELKLNESPKEALDKINKYFKRPDNLISAIRREVSFHYVPKNPEKLREKTQRIMRDMQDSQELQIYISKTLGNCLSPLSNVFVINRILQLTGKYKHNNAWKVLEEEISNVTRWFNVFLDCYFSAWAKNHSYLKTSEKEEIETVSIQEVTLPYFTAD